MNKRIKNKQIDRLSALPDPLLIHILSFLEVKDAAITCLLSKRWQFLWTELPRLVFRYRSWKTDDIGKFVARVHRTLHISSKTNLERFEVSFQYSDSIANDVNVWVEFAVKNKVKEVSLRMSGAQNKHRLHQMMYTNSSLTSLSLYGCIIAPKSAVHWPSLTELKLVNVVLHQHVIENILSGCPILHGLVLLSCYGYSCLEVDSPSLYKLSIFDLAMGYKPSLKISAPYVRHLIISYADRRKLHLTNISSVVTAEIEFIGYYLNYSSEELMDSAKELLEKTKHVKALKLGDNFANVVSMLVKGWRLPQSRRCWLKVSVTGKHDTSGIMGLLESSPSIETLVINIEVPLPGSPFAGDDDLDCDLLHLKTVKIKCFVRANLGSDQMLALARILLKRATILEEMVIVTNHQDTVDLISQTLLTYPRSSQKAVVILS